MAVVVVTGSSSGFGLQAALAFARNGDQVIATMRDTGKAQPLRNAAQAANLTVQTPRLDVTDSDSFPSFVADIVAEFGSIDVLVNNAGILHPGAFEDVPEPGFRLVMETNFFGPMLLSKAVLTANEKTA